MTVLVLSWSLTTHSLLSFFTSVSSSFDFALFLCIIFFLPLALLPELVTNVPIQRLVKCLYSTLGCVITFNPVPFLVSSLRQSKKLFSGTVTGSVGSDNMWSNSEFLSNFSHLSSHPEEGEGQVEVLRRWETVLTYPPTLGRHLLIDPSLAKERGKQINPGMLSMGGEDAPFISSRN